MLGHLKLLLDSLPSLANHRQHLDESPTYDAFFFAHFKKHRRRNKSHLEKSIKNIGNQKINWKETVLPFPELVKYNDAEQGYKK